jgi:hypothetical protein
VHEGDEPNVLLHLTHPDLLARKDLAPNSSSLTVKFSMLSRTCNSVAINSSDPGDVGL